MRDDFRIGIPVHGEELQKNASPYQELDCLELRSPFPSRKFLYSSPLLPLISSVHGPGLGITSPEQWNKEYNEVKKAILFAAEFKIPIVNIHAGVTYQNKKFEKDVKEKVIKKSLRKLAILAKNNEVKLAVENVFKFECWTTKTWKEAETKGWVYPLTAEDLLEMIDAVKPAPLWATYDVGHSLFVSQKPWLEIKKLSNYLVDIHLHDNNLKSDHLPIDMRRQRFRRIIRSLIKTKYQGPLIVEVNRNLSNHITEIEKLRSLEREEKIRRWL